MIEYSRRPPIFDPRYIIKISLPIPKYNYDGSRSKNSLAGESPWAYHLSGRPLSGFEDIKGGYGIGILLNDPFSVRWAKYGDLLVYGQREALIPQVIDAIALPRNISRLPRFDSEDEVYRGLRNWLQRNQSRLKNLTGQILDAYALRAKRTIPKLMKAPTCARCGALWEIWMVSNAKWKLVGRRWKNELLCWKCYRELTKNKGGAKRKMGRDYLIQRAERRQRMIKRKTSD